MFGFLARLFGFCTPGHGDPAARDDGAEQPPQALALAQAPETTEACRGSPGLVQEALVQLDAVDFVVQEQNQQRRPVSSQSAVPVSTGLLELLSASEAGAATRTISATDDRLAKHSTQEAAPTDEASLPRDDETRPSDAKDHASPPPATPKAPASPAASAQVVNDLEAPLVQANAASGPTPSTPAASKIPSTPAASKTPGPATSMRTSGATPSSAATPMKSPARSVTGDSVEDQENLATPQSLRYRQASSGLLDESPVPTSVQTPRSSFESPVSTDASLTSTPLREADAGESRPASTPFRDSTNTPAQSAAKKPGNGAALRFGVTPHDPRYRRLHDPDAPIAVQEKSFSKRVESAMRRDAVRHRFRKPHGQQQPPPAPALDAVAFNEEAEDER